MTDNKSFILYHGSNIAVEQPEIIVVGFYKDFGYGFYCTNLEKQARRWALSKKGMSIVSVYDYRPDNNLNSIFFPDLSEEWLDLIINCRRGIKHNYDIIEGPMADDQIWDYVEELIAGNITREAFWTLAKFRHPTHQIAFCTPQALNTISFKSSYSL